jgi:hypothetical protein
MLLSEVRVLQDDLRRKELERWNWEQSARHRATRIEALEEALRLMWMWGGGRFTREMPQEDVAEVRAALAMESKP